MGFDTVASWEKFDAAMAAIKAADGVFESEAQRRSVIAGIQTAASNCGTTTKQLALFNKIADAVSGGFTVQSLVEKLPFLAGLI